MLSKSSTYAIQASAYLARKEALDSLDEHPAVYTPVLEISEALNIPYHFLKKIIAVLVQHKILRSQRSSRGGVALSKPAKTISLLDIIIVADGKEPFTECLLGLKDCSDATPCAMHTTWAVERTRLRLMFSSTTLADVASRMYTKGLRIA
ncbi:MAG: Rrf2 family transcriptional regulator [Chlorobi bacterium]|nr:MAG: Rrf2 family transcriptional regulator [Bacteroidota bacterium]MBE2265903.1 Rrf2 family transcriptional regulator [Flavobacteriales bacterium]MBL1160936.1 Rrf2 family transcriptional regulator [Chlorobiota bacterium]MBW7852897.1 Rrf2 family transcriptional regulator [Candidatus Kapabacteria bacterium]MCC6330872.1 Rrf2 family transcriptional regulator [Ignavibacteria bacterium]